MHLQKAWDHFALRPQKRGGLLETGTGGRGTKVWRLDRGYRPKKTGETVDHRQNNESVKAVSSRHCPGTSALRNCSFNSRAWAESQGQCPLHCCWATTRSERSPTFAAQLHLPPLDLLIYLFFISPGQKAWCAARLKYFPENKIRDRQISLQIKENWIQINNCNNNNNNNKKKKKTNHKTAVHQTLFDNKRNSSLKKKKKKLWQDHFQNVLDKGSEQVSNEDGGVEGTRQIHQIILTLKQVKHNYSRVRRSGSSSSH